MPATFAPATGTGAHDTHPATSRDVAPVTAANLLSAASRDVTAHIVRSSIGGHPGPDNTLFKIAPAPGNGFVDTVLRAYTHRHALVIRPDDVWLAIVSQFSFYAAAEGTSCNVFDNASGKTDRFTLEISVESDAAQPDVAKLSRRMKRLLQKTVPDADLRDWLVPEFSTTTLVDTTVSCLFVLSGSCLSSSRTATQTRWGTDANYAFSALCGIPRVTLEGERADWELLLTRLDRLKTRGKDFGLPAVAWYHLLHPILVRFVGAFDDPESAENHEFWGGVVVAKEELNGSGGGSKNALSGWITAFCAFSVQGTWLGPELYASAAADAPQTLTAEQFWSTYTRPFPAPEKPKPKPKSKAAKAKAKKALQIDKLDADSTTLPAPTIVIALANIPHAYASAALSLSLKTKPKASGGASASAGANGTTTTRERAYTVLAGLVGTGFSSSRDTELSALGRNDTVRPVVAWWLYERRGAHADADAKEDIPVVPVPAPRVAFDLGPDLDRELDGALADTVGTGVDVGLKEDITSPGVDDSLTATNTHGPAPEPVSEPALAAVQQSDPWSLDLDTPVIPQPPAHPAAPTPSTNINDPHPDADASGAGGVNGSAADADADAGWNTVSWSTPAPASGLGFGFGSSFGFGSGTAPAAVSDPTPAAEPEPESDAFAAWGGQDAPASAAAPAEFESLAEVALETDGAPTGEVEVKPGPGEEQTQEEQEQQTEAPAAAPPEPEDPQPQPVPEPEPDSATAAVETPAAPAGDGEDGEGEDAANEAPAATAAKGGGKNNAGGARGGKGKKKKGKR
ncbi:hypothetical protein B0H11DRAFT_2183571 [Mycena galericulata]|nr:hypothetical protein B0H11DRAFT_2183571 [Mycena galericulata]